MERDFFSRLPPEIVAAILSRLSVRGVALSKCVCKPWLDLIESDDFAHSHLSKSAAALVYSVPATRDTKCCKVFELGDEIDDSEIHHAISEFDFPRKARCEGSAGNFLFLTNLDLTNSELKSDALYVCNPITREFIELRFRDELIRSNRLFRKVAYGFGASKVSGQHKVVRLTTDSDYCHVYTLGTGQWRRVEAATASTSAVSIYYSAFANGNLYWRVLGSNCETYICCFDLETERFSTAPPPPILSFELVALRDCLCAVDSEKIMLWLLEECGAMAYAIEQHPDSDAFGFDCFQPIKVLKNGDILTLCDWKAFYRYSIKTKTYHEVRLFGALGDWIVESLLFTPSFRSLKRSSGMENVITL